MHEGKEKRLRGMEGRRRVEKSGEGRENNEFKIKNKRKLRIGK
jgi:hypothetical protein